MTTHTTIKGSKITIDGLAVTIYPVSGAAPISLQLAPGVTIHEDVQLCDQWGEEVYDKPVHTGKYMHYAYRNERGEMYVFSAEVAGILNRAAAQVQVAEVTTTPATPAEAARKVIEDKRRKMVAQIERGLNGPGSDAAHDCYDIDMRAVDYWYSRQIAAWEAAYPAVAEANAKAAHIAKVEADIADLESSAKGALVYDADGWISSEEQQCRHDDYMAQAVALRATL